MVGAVHRLADVFDPAFLARSGNDPILGSMIAWSGAFAIPNLLQIKVVRKPATEECKGINPFTKEEMVFKAKPAKNVVKIVPMKGMTDMV
jgi:hypothetical protein